MESQFDEGKNTRDLGVQFEPQSFLMDYTLSHWVEICLLATLVGVGGGLGAIVFRKMIYFFHWLFFYWLFPKISMLNIFGFHFGIILMPILGGLIIGPIIFKLCRETKGHGVPEIMESVHLRDGVVRKRVSIIKIIVSSITLGSGGSAGREGPIAQIGGAIGSALAQFFKLDTEKCRLLACCGTAAGIAGTFNAPIGGAFFGIEIVMRRLSFKYIIPALVASTIGALTVSLIVGTRPAFQTTLSGLEFKPLQLATFAGLGIVFGLFSYLWVRFFYLIETLFDQLHKIPDIFKPALGMSVAGITSAVFACHYTINTGKAYEPMCYGIMGVGYGGMDMALMGEFSITMLLLLIISKIVATSFTIGSGGSGGIFAPSLYIGTLLGLAFGYTIHAIAPSMDPFGSPLAYGVGGMAALFAGAARAPLTTMFQIPEMTHSFALFPPLALICGISYIIASLLLKGSSIYTIKLERRGVPRIISEV